MCILTHTHKQTEKILTFNPICIYCSFRCTNSGPVIWEYSNCRALGTTCLITDVLFKSTVNIWRQVTATVEMKS